MCAFMQHAFYCMVCTTIVMSLSLTYWVTLDKSYLLIYKMRMLERVPSKDSFPDLTFS